MIEQSCYGERERPRIAVRRGAALAAFVVAGLALIVVVMLGTIWVLSYTGYAV